MTISLICLVFSFLDAAGQHVRTSFGDGTILSFMEGTSPGEGRYRIKYPFGTGFLQPSAILHGLTNVDGSKFVRRDGQMEKDEELNKQRGKLSSAKLDKKFKLFFGSDHIFLFLRLFASLISTFDDLEEELRTNDPMTDPTIAYYNPMKAGDEDEKERTKLDFPAVMMNLQKTISKNQNAKEFEAFCRRVSKERVHQMAALPKLIEKCADLLVQTAKEDLLLHLYDYCQYSEMVSV
jgi:hypothetical protein